MGEIDGGGVVRRSGEAGMRSGLAVRFCFFEAHPSSMGMRISSFSKGGRGGFFICLMCSMGVIYFYMYL